MEQTWTHIEAAGSDWRRQAACTSRDPELFFPIDTVGPALTQVELARSVCQRCEVRTACLDWALKAGANHGVWDGLSEDERRARYAPTRTAGTHHPLNHPRDALRDDIGRQVGNRFAGRAPHEILRHVTQRHPCRLASPPENLDYIEAQQLFPEALAPVYEATRRLMLGLGDDVVEQFSRTQVSFGSTRKFAWLTPVTKTKALLVIDLWQERTAPQLRNVIRYRDDKFTHQVEVRTPEDVEAVDALGWFNEAATWGRNQGSLNSSLVPVEGRLVRAPLDGPRAITTCG